MALVLEVCERSPGNDTNRRGLASVNQLIKPRVAVTLTPELLIKLPYDYLSRGEHRRLGEMTPSADILSRKLDVYVDYRAITLLRYRALSTDNLQWTRVVHTVVFPREFRQEIETGAFHGANNTDNDTRGDAMLPAIVGYLAEQLLPRFDSEYMHLVEQLLDSFSDPPPS